jgi:hypothetical protein
MIDTAFQYKLRETFVFLQQGALADDERHHS